MAPKYQWLIYWIGAGMAAVGGAIFLSQFANGFTVEASIAGFWLAVIGAIMVGATRDDRP
jgi:hypothetical protein